MVLFVKTKVLNIFDSVDFRTFSDEFYVSVQRLDEPQQCLYFFPLPHGQGAFLGV